MLFALNPQNGSIYECEIDDPNKIITASEGGSGPGTGTLNTMPFWDTTSTLGSTSMLWNGEGLTIDSGQIMTALVDAAGVSEASPAFLIGGAFALQVFSPLTGVGNGWVEFDSFGNNGSGVEVVAAGGTVESPTGVTNGTTIFQMQFNGRDSTGAQESGAAIYIIAEDDFTNVSSGTTFMLRTTAVGSVDPQDRIVIINGNTKQQNGVFALDTSGSDTGIAIGSLPAAPSLGMMAVVNDALAPAVGVQVAAMGAATAIVWWNGTQWTVVGI